MKEWTGRGLRELCHAARRALGIDDLVLAVHDVSFPSAPGEDVGRGTPYSRGASRLMEYADGLGFTGLQLGPQGVTSRGNRSPYDGTVFSRSPSSIALDELRDDPAWEGLLEAGDLDAALAATPPAQGRVHHDHAERAHAAALEAAFVRYRRGASPGMRARFEAFRQGSAWLAHDASFEAHTVEYGTADPSRWPQGAPTLGPAAQEAGERYAFAQFVVHMQHQAFRARVHALGWKAFGDLQVGLSLRDRWTREALFLERYALGAPPSRTDPEGQPWGYGVLRPGSDDARAFFRARIRKMAREYDGVRIDHPHGLVCPWVYDRTLADGLYAVAHGARLFESPDLPDHPDLAPYAIARPEQIDRSAVRHADAWVRSLEPDQIARYAERIAVVVDELAAAGGGDILCEVLSTSPFPLVEVLRRFGLGRFRVTQKADLANPRDGYRSENADPRDWIMVGTHDTPPLARVADGWLASDTAGRRAAYLAERLVLDPTERTSFAASLAQARGGRGPLVQAMFGDLLSSPARHVIVFMSDFLGLLDVYNRPGIINEDNWSLRIPDAFEREHAVNLAAGSAMDVPGALALALRARADTAAYRDLASELDRASASSRTLART
ncbi:MAG TPA: 4-alpha-glucanotransferase [Polyangiaceae bacterium]|nr:4-alpha-glucanotransferase [Polyangiaceae bacterium]